jgi:hypothetical protein
MPSSVTRRIVVVLSPLWETPTTTAPTVPSWTAAPRVVTAISIAPDAPGVLTVEASSEARTLKLRLTGVPAASWPFQLLAAPDAAVQLTAAPRHAVTGSVIGEPSA